MKKMSVVKTKAKSERPAAIPGLALCIARMEAHADGTAMIVKHAQAIQASMPGKEAWERGVMAGL